MHRVVHIWHIQNLWQILFKFGMEGFHQQMSDDFNVALYWANIIIVLHEAEIKLYWLSEKDGSLHRN
jgi:hypothetical protein